MLKAMNALFIILPAEKDRLVELTKMKREFDEQQKHTTMKGNA